MGVVDQIISRRKWYLEKIYLSYPVPVIYLTFNVIYWAAGGMVNGLHYIYPVLDWGDEPGNAVITIVIGVFSLPLIFTMFWVLTLLRDKLSGRLGQSRSPKEEHNHGFTHNV